MKIQFHDMAISSTGILLLLVFFRVDLNAMVTCNYDDILLQLWRYSPTTMTTVAEVDLDRYTNIPLIYLEENVDSLIPR